MWARDGCRDRGAGAHVFAGRIVGKGLSSLRGSEAAEGWEAGLAQACFWPKRPWPSILS